MYSGWTVKKCKFYHTSEGALQSPQIRKKFTTQNSIHIMINVMQQTQKEGTKNDIQESNCRYRGI
jgi:hypothetical protein